MESPEKFGTDRFAKARQWAASFTDADTLSPSDITYLNQYFPELFHPDDQNTFIAATGSDFEELSQLLVALTANLIFVTKAREGQQAQLTRNAFLGRQDVERHLARKVAKLEGVRRELTILREQQTRMAETVEKQITAGTFTRAVIERLATDICAPEVGVTKPSKEDRRMRVPIVGLDAKISHYENPQEFSTPPSRLAELRESRAYLDQPHHGYLAEWAKFYYQAQHEIPSKIRRLKQEEDALSR